MKSIILTALALACSAAAWGSVEFCLGDTDNLNYNCATFTFNSEGCFDLPETDGGWQNPNLRGNTHFVAVSAGLSCEVFGDTGCTTYIDTLTHGSYTVMVGAVSSVSCHNLE